LIETKQDIYNDICRLLTNYEHPEDCADFQNPSFKIDWEAEMYQLLVRIQNRWEDTITVQEG